MCAARRAIEEGVRYGRLTALVDLGGPRSKFVCICDCGETKALRWSSLVSGNTLSCGCIQRESGPWNKGMLGYRPNRKRKNDVPGWNRLPVGSETIRRDRGDGLPRVYRKVADPNVWRLRAVLVWEAANGPVPVGHVVHHDDRDSLNDSLGNLQCLSRAEHVQEHRNDRVQAVEGISQ
jgi:hypothetical protein